ncbi:MAG: hypothetical protein ABSG59_16355 [Verrucomicrobiota bacterium]|jgi:hypothetical protein
MNPKKSITEVQGAAITILSQKRKDCICSTDVAPFKNAGQSGDLVPNWLRNRNIAEFLRAMPELERRLSVVEELEAVVFANLQRAIRLRQSILQKVFSGRI